MSLEQMKKDDLVAELRKSQQDNKQLQSRIAELEASVEQNDNVGNVISEVVDLPYLAVSQFREANGSGGYYVTMKYDLAGNAKILSKEYLNENYKVNWEAVKFLETVVEKQIETESDYEIRAAKKAKADSQGGSDEN